MERKYELYILCKVTGNPMAISVLRYKYSIFWIISYCYFVWKWIEI